MWNGSVDELSLCVINNIPLDHVIFERFLEQIYLMSLYVLFCFLYAYFCIGIYMHSFHSPHIFILYNSVLCSKSFNIFYFIIIQPILCIVH